MYDAKYTNHIEIKARIARIHKHKEMSDEDILEWCAECCIEYIQDSSYYVEHLSVKLPVVNRIVQVPCYLHKINDLYYAISEPKSVVRYIHNGSYLILEENYKRDYVFMNFWGLPIDPKTSYPLILKGHEQACQAFCVRNLYYEDFMTGKIDGQRWMYIVSEFEKHIQTARSGMKYFDNEDMRQQNIIQGNTLVNPLSRKPNHLY